MLASFTLLSAGGPPSWGELNSVTSTKIVESYQNENLGNKINLGINSWALDF